MGDLGIVLIHIAAKSILVGTDIPLSYSHADRTWLLDGTSRRRIKNRSIEIHNSDSAQPTDAPATLPPGIFCDRIQATQVFEYITAI